MKEDGLQGFCAACLMKWAMEESGIDLGRQFSASEAPRLEIPGYEVRQEVARGGMGIVYRAREIEPNRTVALKMLLPHQASSPAMLERFRLEVRAIAALDHPSILPVYDVGEHNGLASRGKLSFVISLHKQSLTASWPESTGPP